MFNDVTTFWDFIIVLNFAFLLFVFFQEAWDSVTPGKKGFKIIRIKISFPSCSHGEQNQCEKDLMKALLFFDGVNLDGEASTYFTVNQYVWSLSFINFCHSVAIQFMLWLTDSFTVNPDFIIKPKSWWWTKRQTLLLLQRKSPNFKTWGFNAYLQRRRGVEGGPKVAPILTFKPVTTIISC